MTSPRPIGERGGAERWPSRMLPVLAALGFFVFLTLPAASLLFALPLVAAAVATAAVDSAGRYGAGALLGATTSAAAWLISTEVSLQTVLIVAMVDVVCGVLPWLVTLTWRSRQRVVAREMLDLERQERARHREAEIVRARERERLAEELHDDLGHALSLVALNLGRLELDQSLGDEQRGSIATSRRHVADAVARLGASVELLRGDASPPLEPTGRTPDVDVLAAKARAAGAEIEISGDSEPQRLAAFGGSTVHRIVQEGITNALRHAPGEPIRVGFEEEGGRLLISIVNRIRADAESDLDRSGYGLAALRERVRLAGGTFDAAEEDGRFVLAVSLPMVGVQPTDGTEADGTRPSPVVETYRRFADTRRRTARLAWRAVLVPVAALLVVVLLAQLVDVYRAHRAELDPDDFAGIAVGDRRADLSLPAHEVDVSDDTGAEGDCLYFAITSNPLDDAYGDAYRICLVDDVVVSAERLSPGAA